MPDFNQYDSSQILQLLHDEKVELIWDEYYPKLAADMREHNLPDGEWRLKWDKGSVHVGGSKDKPMDGKRRAAIVVYLTLKGVDFGFAHELSKCYCNSTLPIGEE
jgi:hypothetical protein